MSGGITMGHRAPSGRGQLGRDDDRDDTGTPGEAAAGRDGRTNGSASSRAGAARPGRRHLATSPSGRPEPDHPSAARVNHDASLLWGFSCQEGSGLASGLPTHGESLRRAPVVASGHPRDPATACRSATARCGAWRCSVPVVRCRRTRARLPFGAGAPVAEQGCRVRRHVGDWAATAWLQRRRWKANEPRGARHGARKLAPQTCIRLAPRGAGP